MSQVDDFPVLSERERDRRWNTLRALMRERKLEGLLVFGLKGREQVDRYVTNDRSGSIVVFPLQGEMVQLVWTSYMTVSHFVSAERGEPSWVNDLRAGITGPDVVKALRDRGLDRAAIGVVGLNAHGPGEPEGWVPHTTWSHVLEQLPGARFEEVTDAVFEIMLTKSDEEMALVRRSAEIGERVCEAILKVVAPGVSEAELYAAGMAETFRHGAQGCVSPYLTPMILHSGPNNPSWGPPPWLVRGQTPRRLQAGDVIVTELFPTYGGIESQQQLAIALAPVSPVVSECAEIARRAYEVGLNALRPGRTFGEVADAMQAVVRDTGAWNLTPLIHSLAPLCWVSSTGAGILDHIPGMNRYREVRSTGVKGRDLVLRPGMTFELEPNACKGRHRVNVGGTVVVTEHGALELNKIATRLQVR